MRQSLANILSLLTSTGTLLCCALPSLLVAIGAGTAVAAAVSAAPWLAELSRHKMWLLIAGLMIALNFFLVYRPKGTVACTIGGGTGCPEASRVNRVILWISTGIYVLGLFAAYWLLPLRVWLS